MQQQQVAHYSGYSTPSPVRDESESCCRNFSYKKGWCRGLYIPVYSVELVHANIFFYPDKIIIENTKNGYLSFLILGYKV